ncbi:MAG: hypothetical protein ACM3O3_04560 [Syntrophothermus sp.]|nr:hypothetical protein [Ignavibacteriaceae bacterium]
MAEIKIQEKKRSILPWVIVIVVLAIIAIAAYWYFTHDDKNTMEKVEPDTGMVLILDN